jgi:zinc protease
LGYAIDSAYYRIPPYNQYLKAALAKLTLNDVNRAIKAHLRTNRLVISVVSRDGEALKRQLASEDPSPMTYNSPKPAAIAEEDKIVEKWPLHLRSGDITVTPVGEVFQ